MNTTEGNRADDEPFDCVFKSKAKIVLIQIVVLTGDSGVGKSNILLR